GLARLPAQLLAAIQDSLPLVRFRLPEGSNFRSNLPDDLLIRSADRDLGGRRHLDVDPLRRRVPDRVGVAERQGQVPALARGAEADTHQVKVTSEAAADALDHV